MGIEYEALRPLAWTSITRATAATASANTAIPSAGFYVLGVEKSTSDGAYFLFGTSSGVTASSTTGMHLQAGEKIPVYVPPGITHLAYIRKTADETIFLVKTGD